MIPIATAASSPITTVNETSGPPLPLRPWSRVCWTTIGTITWPSEATTASASVPRSPSVSSGLTAMPRRMVSRAAMSSPESMTVPAIGQRRHREPLLLAASSSSSNGSHSGWSPCS